MSDRGKRAGSGALSVGLRKNAEIGTVETSTGNLPGGTLVDSPPLTSKEPDISGWPIEAIMPAIDVACWCFRQFLLIHAIE